MVVRSVFKYELVHKSVNQILTKWLIVKLLLMTNWEIYIALVVVLSVHLFLSNRF